MANTATVFVDTSVLVHAEDRAHADRHVAARAWLRALWLGHRGRLSNQVLTEFYDIATRRLTPAMPPGDARAEVRRYQRWNPWVCDHATVENAWAVESRYGLGWWNALIVAAAQQQGCAWLLSEELPHEQQIDGVRVLNPFRVGPDILDLA